MRPRVIAMMVLTGISAASALTGCAPKPEVTSPPSVELARTEVFYARGANLEEKVRLSDEMSAKVVEIVKRKPVPFDRGNLKADPRGSFLIGEKVYSFYGFIAADPQRGDSWDDPVLDRFWNELNRVNGDLSVIKDFKP